MTFCFCIDDDTHVVVHDDVIHRDYSRVINKSGKKKRLFNKKSAVYTHELDDKLVLHRISSFPTLEGAN